MLVLLLACAGDPVVGSVQSVPIGMADGVRLAADVILPVQAAPAPVPTVLIQTRYWRSFGMVVPDRPGHAPQGPRDGIADALAAAGYAVVIVDVRGTGASEGVWKAPFAPPEVEDARAVIDWIVAQPWSDGKVGAYGVSYEGSTALLAAATGHPALKAALAREVEWDLTEEILAPAGVPLRAFAAEWGQAVGDLDRGRYPSLFPASAKYVVRGVRPLDDDPDGALLAERLRTRTVTDVAAAVATVRSGTDPFGSSGWSAGELGPAAHRDALRRSATRIGLWGAWWDSATAMAVVAAAVELGLPEPSASATPRGGLVDARVGAWTHEGDAGMAPFGAGTPVPLAEVVAWFDTWLRGPGGPPRAEWFEAGRDQWHSALELVDPERRTWWFAPAGVLSETAAPAPAPFEVAPVAEGDHTRWSTGVLRPMDFRVPATLGGARWTSAPLTAELRLAAFTGLECPATGDRPGVLAASLEAVSPSGEAVRLTDGFGRDPAFLPLLPAGVSVPAGWALRVRLTGGDPDTFSLPEAGPVTWTPRGECRLSVSVLRAEPPPRAP